MIAGCYTLDLYCDNEKAIDVFSRPESGRIADNHHLYDEFPHQYTAEEGTACRAKARAEGWLIGPDRQLCPRCSGKPRPAVEKPYQSVTVIEPPDWLDEEDRSRFTETG